MVRRRGSQRGFCHFVEGDVRVIPLRYPSSGQLGKRRVGRARVWRDRRDGRCGYRHVAGVERAGGGVERGKRREEEEYKRGSV